MTLKDFVTKLQQAMNEAGSKLTVDGQFGSVTTNESEKYEFEIVAVPRILPIGKGNAPWLDEAKKHAGKKETDSAFNRYLSGFWRFVGLPGFTSIIGSARAWCGLFCASMLITVGLAYQKNGAGAKNWDQFGVAIDWKNNGIPRGAIVRINHGAKCSSGSGNHVAFANGSCAPADLRAGSINLYGGNQSDQAKVSAFPVGNICAVRWPADAAPPAKVTKSDGCRGAGGGDSTR